MISNTLRIIEISSGYGLIISLLLCTESPKTIEYFSTRIPPKPQPKSYVCYRTSSPVYPDGVLDEQAWAAVSWTDYFTDIGLNLADFPENLPVPLIHSTRTTFESFIPAGHGNQKWVIYQDGRIDKLSDSLSAK